MCSSAETTANCSKLSQAFLRQRPLYVNLLDDLGSTDFFMIDGDSLVMDCLSSSSTGFQHGGQTLQALYLMESFLHGLRGCLNARFCIVFFEEQQALWEVCHPCMYLVRQILLQHMHQNLELEMLKFSSWTSQEWLQHVRKVQCVLGALVQAWFVRYSSNIPVTHSCHRTKANNDSAEWLHNVSVCMQAKPSFLLISDLSYISKGADTLRLPASMRDIMQACAMHSLTMALPVSFMAELRFRHVH